MSTQNTAIARAIALLTAAGAKYKSIAADGLEYGDLVVAKEPEKKKRPLAPFPHGERSAYIRAHLEGMKAGDCKLIPLGPYGKALPAGVAPMAHSLWGSGGFITEVNPDGIEVLRVK